MKKRLVDRQEFWGFLFICPWLIGFLIFTLGPMLSSLALSLYKYDLANAKFVGLENYRRLFTEDPLFWRSLKITSLYALLTVPLGVTGSLAIAWLLNQPVKGVRLYRTLFYLPSMVPAVASALKSGGCSERSS